MQKVEPDAIAKIRFYSTSEGGRHGPTPENYLGCIFEYQNENFECRLLLSDVGSIVPGAEVTVPIKFLYSGLIRPRLRVGDKFSLRELHRIGEGEITSVYS